MCAISFVLMMISRNLEKAKEYIFDKYKYKHMHQADTENEIVDEFFVINILKKAVSEHNELRPCIPSDDPNKELPPPLTEKSFLKIKNNIYQNCHNEMEVLGNKVRCTEKNIVKNWEHPFRLMGILIEMATEITEETRQKILEDPSDKNKFQQGVLVLINARSIQISSEILTLLKAGFVDGALARWRSLHELVVISLFLKGKDDKVSERYFEHGSIKEYKESKDYEQYKKKIGLKTTSTKNKNDQNKECDTLIEKYRNEFKHKNNYEWIPKTIPRLQDPNFRKLEKVVKMDHLRSIHNMSNNAIHGGAGGLRRVGLPEHMQNELPVGPTNYGFAIPLLNTACSLSRITTNLLANKNDLESLLQKKILKEFCDDISVEAIKIQNKQYSILQTYYKVRAQKAKKILDQFLFRQGMNYIK